MRHIIHGMGNQIVRFSCMRMFNLHLDHPVVSFTFDDAPASAFERGGEILSGYGYAATYYIALSFLNSKEQALSFTQKHLENALESGNELGCHTFSHICFQAVESSCIEEDLNKNAREFQRIFPQEKFYNFSYPFGGQTIAGKKLIEQGFRSSRSIRGGINSGKIDLNSLDAVRLYERSESLEAIYQKIAEVEKRKGWLIFYTHDVQKNYSEYGCSSAYLDAVVKRCIQCGIHVMPVNKVLDLAGAP